jgi:hypothetical protein
MPTSCEPDYTPFRVLSPVDELERIRARMPKPKMFSQ